MSVIGVYMMIPKIEFKRSMKAIKKAYMDARKPVMEAIGRHWHEKFRPLHFEFEAYARYGYQPRNKSYEIGKGRKMGHRRPLVWSGRSEQASRFARFTTTKSSVKVTMTFPTVSMIRDGKEIAVPYFSLKGRIGSGPDKVRELKTVTPEEIGILQDKAADMLTLAMAKATGDPQIAAIADVA